MQSTTVKSSRLKNHLQILLLLTAASLGGLKAYLDERLAQALEHQLPRLWPAATWHYSAATWRLPAAVALDQVQLTLPSGLHVSAAELRLHDLYRFYSSTRLPSQIRLDLRDLRYPLAEWFPNQPPVLWSAFGYGAAYLGGAELNGLGFGTLHADVALQLYPQTDPGQLALHLQLNSPQLGQLDLEMQLQQVNFAAFSPWQSQWVSLRRSYHPGALLAAYTNRLAQRNNLPVATQRQQLAQQLETDLQASNLGLPPGVYTALSALLREQTPVQWQLRPSTPLSLHELFARHPSTWAKQLGLEMNSSAAAS